MKTIVAALLMAFLLVAGGCKRGENRPEVETGTIAPAPAQGSGETSTAEMTQTVDIEGGSASEGGGITEETPGAPATATTTVTTATGTSGTAGPLGGTTTEQRTGAQPRQ